MAESGAAYIKRKMSNRNPNHSSTLKRLKRLQRKAKLMDADKLGADDTLVEAFNMEMYLHADDNKNVSHYRILHATKGIRKRSKKRDIFIEVANKAQMWKIIQHNLSRHSKGMFHEIIKFQHKS